MSNQEQHPIPLIYRLAFNWVEVFVATAGAIQAYVKPQALLAVATPSIAYSPILHPLFTQLTGAWLLIVFNDAVTLRTTQDPVVWRLLQTAGLLSDLFYILSVVEERGPAWFWDPTVWNSNDWTVIATTLPVTFVKLACVAGLGFKKSEKRKEQ